MFHALYPHGFENVVGCNRTLLQVRIGDARTETNVGVGGKVKDAINVHLHGFSHIAWIANIALDHHHIAGIHMMLNEFCMAAGKVVQDNDTVSSRHQAVDEVRPDETRTAGDQGSHEPTTKTARIREMVPTQNPNIALKRVKVNHSVPEESGSGEVNT